MEESGSVNTVDDAINRYMRDIAPRTPKSIKDKERLLQAWRNYAGHLPIKQLGAVEISNIRIQIQRTRLKNGNFKKPATVNRYLAAISHVLSTAEREWGWIEASPMTKVTKLKEPRGRVRFLNSIERQQLLKECKSSQNPHLYTIVVVAISTGMQKSEILNLKCSDLDFDRSRCILHETKNGERRSVPIVGHAKELLINLFLDRDDSELVFPSPTGKPYYDLKKAWEGAIIRSKTKDFRFHDVRHCTASYLAMNGATSHEIAEVLGHKSLDMVKRYAHLCESHVAKVVENMTSNIF